MADFGQLYCCLLGTVNLDRNACNDYYDCFGHVGDATQAFFCTTAPLGRQHFNLAAMPKKGKINHGPHDRIPLPA